MINKLESKQEVSPYLLGSDISIYEQQYLKILWIFYYTEKDYHLRNIYRTVKCFCLTSRDSVLYLLGGSPP